MNGIQRLICFLGRVCFSVIFIVGGIHKIMNWDATEQLLVNQLLDVLSKSYHISWVKPLLDQLLPMAPTLLVLATIAELGGGVLVLLGLQVRLGAFILLLFMIPTTVIFHNFWMLEGVEQQTQLIMFMKNLSIIGGALVLLAFGKGTRAESRG